MEEIKFDEAQILSLQPNDIVVFRMKGKLTDNAFEQLRTVLKSVIPDNKVLILEDNAELSIVRLEEAK